MKYKPAPSKSNASSKQVAPSKMAYKDRNLMGVSPLKEQFEPTDAQPVRAHFKMAGGC